MHIVCNLIGNHPEAGGAAIYLYDDRIHNQGHFSKTDVILIDNPHASYRGFWRSISSFPTYDEEKGSVVVLDLEKYEGEEPRVYITLRKECVDA